MGTIAVVGLPEVAEALRAAGLEVVAGEPAQVAAAARGNGGAGFIVAGASPTERVLASVQAAAGRAVVWVGLDRSLPAPAGATEVRPPVALSRLLEALGSPAPVEGVVTEDGSVAQGGPEPQGAASGEDWLWGPEPAQAPVEPEAGDSQPWGTEPAHVAEDWLWEQAEAPRPAAAVAEAPVEAGAGWWAPREGEELETEGLWPSPQQAKRRRLGPAPVVVVTSRKGGVGVTSFAASLAHRAATGLGLERVALVDMSGQDDLGPYLWVPEGALPSAYDAVLQGDPKAAFSPPVQLAAARPSSLPEAGFGVVLGGEGHEAARALQGAVSELQAVADLVVVIAGPKGCPGASFVAHLTDGSRDGFVRLVRGWREVGPAPCKAAVVVNRAAVPPVVPPGDIDEVARAHGAEVVAVVPEKDQVGGALASGGFPVDPDWSAALDTVLGMAL